jgi:hypothetical protein
MRSIATVGSAERRTGSGLRALAAAAVAALCACVPVEEAPPPPERTAEPAPPAVTAESAEARAYYARVQTYLLSQGLLRTETDPPDRPFTSRDLAENFIRIALFDEYVSERGTLVARPTESRLRRWAAPVRLTVEFGPSVPKPQQARDRASVAALAQRLSRVSGHPISVAAAGGNFTILFLSEDERRRAGPRIAEIIPGIAPSAIRGITEMAPTTYCLVYAFSADGSAAYTRALAVIRAEHPDLLRLSCIHEEIAQGLGLANDSPAARPSIFNDDEEFALLTRQDELMLRILYDRRLRPGMTPAEARPIVDAIAAEVVAAPAAARPGYAAGGDT